MVISEYNQRFKNSFDDPLNGPIHLLAINALLSQKKNKEALSIANSLINSPQMSQKVKSDAILQKSKILEDDGQFDAALKVIGIQTAPDKDTQTSLELLKGQSYLGLHDYDKAWQIFSTTAKEEPDNAAAYCYQAHTRHAQGQDAESASLFMKCFNTSHDESYRQDALFNALLMYGKAGMMDDALKSSKLYLTDYPQGPHFYDTIFNLADLYSQSKQYNQAVEILKTVSNSASYQYQSEALFQVAYNFQLAGKTPEALRFYGILINQNSDPQLRLMSLKNSALIYSQNDDEDKAAEAMDTIVRQFGSNDLPTKDYLWLLEHWQQKNDPKRMLNVLAVVQKRPVAGFESLGIQFFTAEEYRMENNCSQAIPIYKVIVDVPGNPYEERSRAGESLCRGLIKGRSNLHE